jgi:transcriptional regulator with XRE-family HTH domain
MSCLTPTIKLDPERIRRAMRSRGFKSVQSLADSLGLHRNTVGSYLTGKTGFPEALGPILAALNLDPAEVITLQRPLCLPKIPSALLPWRLRRSELSIFGCSKSPFSH